jgi:hypothetical protein
MSDQSANAQDLPKVFSELEQHIQSHYPESTIFRSHFTGEDDIPFYFTRDQVLSRLDDYLAFEDSTYHRWGQDQRTIVFSHPDEYTHNAITPIETAELIGLLMPAQDYPKGGRADIRVEGITLDSDAESLIVYGTVEKSSDPDIQEGSLRSARFSPSNSFANDIQAEIQEPLWPTYLMAPAKSLEDIYPGCAGKHTITGEYSTTSITQTQISPVTYEFHINSAPHVREAEPIVQLSHGEVDYALLEMQRLHDKAEKSEYERAVLTGRREIDDPNAYFEILQGYAQPDSRFNLLDRDDCINFLTEKTHSFSLEEMGQIARAIASQYGRFREEGISR